MGALILDYWNNIIRYIYGAAWESVVWQQSQSILFHIDNGFVLGIFGN